MYLAEITGILSKLKAISWFTKQQTEQTFSILQATIISPILKIVHERDGDNI